MLGFYSGGRLLDALCKDSATGNEHSRCHAPCTCHYGVGRTDILHVHFCHACEDLEEPRHTCRRRNLPLHECQRHEHARANGRRLSSTSSALIDKRRGVLRSGFFSDCGSDKDLNFDSLNTGLRNSKNYLASLMGFADAIGFESHVALPLSNARRWNSVTLAPPGSIQTTLSPNRSECFARSFLF